MSLAKRIENALIDAARILGKPIHKRIEWARDEEKRLDGKSVGSKASIAVFEAILENLRISKNEWIPMCQDTGMFDVFVDVGRSCPFLTPRSKKLFSPGVKRERKTDIFDPRSWKNRCLEGKTRKPIPLRSSGGILPKAGMWRSMFF